MRQRLARLLPPLLAALAALPQVALGQGERAVPTTTAATPAARPAADKGADGRAPSPRQLALQELQAVDDESGKVGDYLAATRIRARVANLLWPHYPQRARESFVALWRNTGGPEVRPAEREEARTEILKSLYSRDPSLAANFLEEAKGREAAGDGGLRAQVSGTDPDARRRARLAQELVEVDAARAAALLEQVTAASVTPGALAALVGLRDKNPALADYVVVRTLEGLKARPTAVAFTSLHLLSDYVFPASQSAGDSLITNPPEGSVQMQFFSAAYEILQRSLQESEAALAKEQQYSDKDLRFRAIYQAQIALLLSALAPRLAPQFAPSLAALADKLRAVLPPNVAEMARFTSARRRRLAAAAGRAARRGARHRHGTGRLRGVQAAGREDR